MLLHLTFGSCSVKIFVYRKILNCIIVFKVKVMGDPSCSFCKNKHGLLYESCITKSVSYFLQKKVYDF